MAYVMLSWGSGDECKALPLGEQHVIGWEHALLMDLGGLVQLELRVDPAWIQLLKLHSDEPLSNVAFDGFNSRPYTWAPP